MVMITSKLVLDVFSRMNEWSEGKMLENFVSLGIIEDNEDGLNLIKSTVHSLVVSQASMEIFGMPVADPYEAAAKAFLAGVLCGRLEFTQVEED